jgi:hypothetical protein
VAWFSNKEKRGKMNTIQALTIGMANNECIGDATNFDDFLQVHGITNRTLLTGNMATKTHVTLTIRQAENLTKRDVFLLYFAGHTHKIKARLEGGEEKDGKDEVLELYDSEITDNELTAMLQKLKCTVIFVADTCFAASIVDKIKAIKTPTIHLFASSSEANKSFDHVFTTLMLKRMEELLQFGTCNITKNTFEMFRLVKLSFDNIVEHACNVAEDTNTLLQERQGFLPAFRKLAAQKPVYITNRNREDTEMATPDKKTFIDRTGQPLNLANVDDEGVIDMLEGVEVLLGWEALSQNPQYVNTGYSVTHCNGTSPISVIFHKATPEDCLELVRDRLLPDLFVTLFGDNNMEMDLRNIGFDIKGWCKEPFAVKLLNPTKQELWEMIGGYFTSLSMRLKFKGQDFDFKKVGAVGMDNTRKGGGTGG